MKMGVADFSGMYSDAQDSPTKLTKGMFSGCTALTEVIFPNFNNGMNGTTDNMPTIYASTFEDCKISAQ